MTGYSLVVVRCEAVGVGRVAVLPAARRVSLAAALGAVDAARARVRASPAGVGAALCYFTVLC